MQYHYENTQIERCRELSPKIPLTDEVCAVFDENLERDARIEAERLYTDPIHQFTTFDEDEYDLKVEPAAPDFDL